MAKRIPKVELYGTVRFLEKRYNPEQKYPEPYLIIELGKLVSKDVTFLPKNLTIGFRLLPNLYESLKSQVESSKDKKLKIKLIGELEFILNYTNHS